ncbi:MAG: hypothetical protein IT529_04645 [Burkholderiales bacterium]|nr:hypothetical protein [Burkholderiales bacterium]
MQVTDISVPGLRLHRFIEVLAFGGEPPACAAFPVTRGDNEVPKVALRTEHIAFAAGDLLVAFAGFEITNRLNLTFTVVGRLGLAENSDDVPGRRGWTPIDRDGGGPPVLAQAHFPVQRSGIYYFREPMSRRVQYSLKVYRQNAPGTENAIWEGTDVKLQALIFRA